MFFLIQLNLPMQIITETETLSFHILHSLLAALFLGDDALNPQGFV
jgi:hypothetical protein